MAAIEKKDEQLDGERLMQSTVEGPSNALEQPHTYLRVDLLYFYRLYFHSGDKLLIVIREDV